jgi:hypothetical protein
MMRDLERKSLHLVLLPESWNGRLQDRHHDILHRTECTLFLLHQLRRIRSVIVRRDLEYRLVAKLIKANGTLIPALLLLLIQVQRAAEIQAIRESM